MGWGPWLLSCLRSPLWGQVVESCLQASCLGLGGLGSPFVTYGVTNGMMPDSRLPGASLGQLVAHGM